MPNPFQLMPYDRINGKINLPYELCIIINRMILDQHLFILLDRTSTIEKNDSWEWSAGFWPYEYLLTTTIITINSKHFKWQLESQEEEIYETHQHNGEEHDHEEELLRAVVQYKWSNKKFESASYFLERYHSFIRFDCDWSNEIINGFPPHKAIC